MPADEFVDDVDPYDPEAEKKQASNAKAKYEHDTAVARSMLEMRKGAYVRVFVAGVPSVEDRQIVLRDLQTFCRHGQSVYHDNPRLHVLLTGRQEVTLRIDDFMNLSVDALIDKYTGS